MKNIFFTLFTFSVVSITAFSETENVSFSNWEWYFEVNGEQVESEQSPNTNNLKVGYIYGTDPDSSTEEYFSQYFYGEASFHIDNSISPENIDEITLYYTVNDTNISGDLASPNLICSYWDGTEDLEVEIGSLTAIEAGTYSIVLTDIVISALESGNNDILLLFDSADIADGTSGTNWLSISMNDSYVQVSTVPEPATVACIIGGLALVFALSRKRK